MVNARRLEQGRERYLAAKAAFAENRRIDGWVHLLAVVCCVAAAHREEVNIDAVQMARDMGVIE